MKPFVWALIALMLPVVSYGAANTETETQTKHRTDANITGHVESAKNGEHLPYITIQVAGTTIGVTTDATGHYFLKDLPVGELTVKASSIGYKNVEHKVTTVPGKTLEVNFLLEEQAISLDEVVVSATRNETNKKGAAVVVNVASGKLFESTASSNLSETMSYQPGLRVENTCGNCTVPQLRINGLEGHYSQILLDNRAIFSSLASVYGLEQLPVSMIERVEVVRGGGSALYGSNAIGGVVNIITKEPLRNSISLTNTTGILSTGDTDINTSVNGSFISDDHRAGAYIFGMVKERDGYDHNGDGFTDMPTLSSETVGFRTFLRTSDYSRLVAEYHHIHEFRRGGNNLELPPHQADIAEQLNHRIDGGGLNFDMYTPGYSHRLSVYASGQGIARESYFGAEKYSNSYGHTSDRTFVAGTQYTHSMKRLIFMPAELTAGAEYNYNLLDDNYIGLGRKILQKTYIAGGFLQNEWKNEKVGILLGARLDKHNLMTRTVFSPRANVRYSPSEEFSLRASYSSGYRAPQTYNEDLHIAAVSGMLSVIDLDPNLKPEYSHSVSASADLYHNFGRVQSNILLEGFYTILDDVFTLDKTGEDPDAGFIYYTRRNGAGAVVKGLNLEARLGIPGAFEVQAGYTLQQSRYTEPEKWSDQLEPQRKMFRSPDSYGYLTSTFTLSPALKASVFANYTGPMLVQHTTPEGDFENTTQSFFELGTRLAYTFRITGSINLELSGGVKNILDEYQPDIDYGQMKDAAYIYGPSFPRMFFVGVKLSM